MTVRAFDTFWDLPIVLRYVEVVTRMTLENCIMVLLDTNFKAKGTFSCILSLK